MREWEQTKKRQRQIVQAKETSTKRTARLNRVCKSIINPVTDEDDPQFEIASAFYLQDRNCKE
jgi:hypothetical protein